MLSDVAFVRLTSRAQRRGNSVSTMRVPTLPHAQLAHPREAVVGVAQDDLARTRARIGNEVAR